MVMIGAKMPLLNTSELLCCVNRYESQHEEAVNYLESTNRNITHNYILVECVALAFVKKFSRLQTLEFISDLLKHPDSDNSTLAQPGL